MMDINSRAYCKTHHVGKKVEFELEKYQKFNLTVPLRSSFFLEGEGIYDKWHIL